MPLASVPPTSKVPTKPILSVIASNTPSIPVSPSQTAPMSLRWNRFCQMPVPVSLRAFSLYDIEFVMISISASAAPAEVDIFFIASSACEKLEITAAPICHYIQKGHNSFQFNLKFTMLY